MSIFSDYARKVRSTTGMWVVSITTVTMGGLCVLHPEFLQRLLSYLGISPLLVSQRAIVATIYLIGALIVLLQVLLHVKKLESSKNETDINVRLEKMREKILVLVSQNRRLRDRQLSELAGIGIRLTSYHLHELKNVGFIVSSNGANERSQEVETWDIELLGRKYLSRHSLIRQ